MANRSKNQQKMVECPKCEQLVFPHALKLSCYGHVRSDDPAQVQRAQEIAREEQYAEG